MVEHVVVFDTSYILMTAVVLVLGSFVVLGLDFYKFLKEKKRKGTEEYPLPRGVVSCLFTRSKEKDDNFSRKVVSHEGASIRVLKDGFVGSNEASISMIMSRPHTALMKSCGPLSGIGPRSSRTPTSAPS